MERVPIERTVTDYYTVEHITDYIPQLKQEKKAGYVPVEWIENRVEYLPVEKYPKSDVGVL